MEAVQHLVYELNEVYNQCSTCALHYKLFSDNHLLRLQKSSDGIEYVNITDRLTRKEMKLFVGGMILGINSII